MYQAEEYLNQKIQLKVKKIEKDHAHPVKWNLSSGDHSKMVEEEKKKQ